HARLGFLGRRGLVAATLAVGLRSLLAALALALQDRDLALLVERAARLLRLLVERVEQEPERGETLPVLCLGSRGRVRLNALGDAQRSKPSDRGVAPTTHRRGGRPPAPPRAPRQGPRRAAGSSACSRG